MSMRLPRQSALRLLVEPEPAANLPIDPPTSTGRRVQFIAHLEGTGEFVVQSHQPVVDGARVLLERGFSPHDLLTMRHAGKAYDSFKPLPIGQWAKWTYGERDKGGLARQPWMPRAAPLQTKKQGSGEGGGP